MNDIRNLMHKLGGDLDYKEFGAAAAAAEAARAWSVLKRLERATDEQRAPAPRQASVAARLQPEAEPALATQLRAAAFARSGRGGGGQGFSLGQYVAGPVAAASNPEADRKLPLAEVFARLSQARTRVVG